MIAIQKKVGQAHCLIEIENDLKHLQEAVGGYIQCLEVVPGILLICNEEGKMRQLKPNVAIDHDVICGDILFVGDGYDDFVSLDIEQISFIDYLFKGGEIK